MTERVCATKVLPMKGKKWTHYHALSVFTGTQPFGGILTFPKTQVYFVVCVCENHMNFSWENLFRTNLLRFKKLTDLTVHQRTTGPFPHPIIFVVPR